ncbi:MAG: ABC transporter permease [Trueperaceae bacterium]|nr:ABC transporter permease [Trueperaceae bacterium]
MSGRVAATALAVVTLLSLWLAPWAVFNRESGARGAVTLLPDRVIDFTGRAAPLEVPGLGAVLILSIAGLLAMAGAAALRPGARRTVWLVAGTVLTLTTAVGLRTYVNTHVDARAAEVRSTLEAELADPGGRTDVEGLEVLLDRFEEQSVEETRQDALRVGVRIRRLPYTGLAPGLAAFLVLVSGGMALALGARRFPAAERALQRVSDVGAIPAIAILLALAAAGVVILMLQPTPLGSDVVLQGWREVLAGRLDTLFFAYWTLFAGPLGTFEGFTEALKFATPLMFTGLGVAFGFKAGLFNIGAPGQMVMGALFAMFAGIYLPGPALFVMPAAVLAAALGGAAWGAIPGFLKARFGAHEVINTILLNFIASSLLLFVLSSSPVFAASALRVLAGLGIALAVVILAALVGPIRRRAGRAPRLTFALVGVALVVVMAFAGWPRPGDGPVTLSLPFKEPGSEPKSVPLQEGARLPQLPALFGVDAETMVGSAEVNVNAAAGLAAGLAGVVLVFGGRFGARTWRRRAIAAVLVAAAAYGIGALLGWTRLPFTVPPSKLNFGFVIALATAVFMQIFLWRTKWGYELRAVGVAPKAAEYGGASIFRNTVMAMAISGAFAGLSATHYVLGGALEGYTLRQSLPTNDGFDGIAVALLGANNPVGVVLSAFLFGVLKHGGSIMNITFSDLTRDVVSMVLALVVLFIAAKGFLPDQFTDPIKRAAARRRKRQEQEDDVPVDDLEGEGA